MTTTEPGLAEAVADIQVVREQLMAQLADGDLKSLVLDNLLPLIEGIANGAQRDLAELDDIVEELGGAVDGLIEDTGEIIMPETAAKIAGVFQCGKLIADMLEKQIAKLDDLSKKKAKELIGMYRQGVALVVKDLEEITAPPEEDDPAATAEAAAGETPDPDETKEQG